MAKLGIIAKVAATAKSVATTGSAAVFFFAVFTETAILRLRKAIAGPNDNLLNLRILSR
jgi:hypothetical protein